MARARKTLPKKPRAKAARRQTRAAESLRTERISAAISGLSAFDLCRATYNEGFWVFSGFRVEIIATMGIKFLCPNGHRLNVKAFLAGKRAVCPKCGEKVLVPTQSDPNASKSKREATSAASASQNAAPGTAIAQPTVPTSAEVSHTQAAPTLAAVAPGAAATDPIAEAPTAVWYLRPPSGGQYGPASADVMRSWMAEGRVSGDSLVWRSDWPDWRSAAATFPQLGGNQAAGGSPLTAPAPAPVPAPSVVSNNPMPSAVAVQPFQYAQPSQPQFTSVVVPQVQLTGPLAPVGVPVGTAIGYSDYAGSSGQTYGDALSRTKRRRQKGADATMIVSGILVALVVILFVILGVVLSQSSETPTAPARQTHKAKTTPHPAKHPLKSQPAEKQPDSNAEDQIDTESQDGQNDAEMQDDAMSDE